MWREGIGENGSFGSYHPWVITAFYSYAIIIIMFSTSPIFLGISLLLGIIYKTLILGAKTLRNSGLMILVITLFGTLANGFFTHNGATVLFYINTNPITVEALVFGMTMALLVCAMISWFGTFNSLLTSDKLIHIFGRVIPVIGLVVSMIFRYIPLLKNRYEEISMGQKSMGNQPKGKIIRDADILTKKISILISWSLESSIESADSMSSRGYGLRGRTSFTLFKFQLRDGILLLIMTILFLSTMVLLSLGYGKMTFYPEIKMEAFDSKWTLAFLTTFILLLIPIIIDLIGEYRWKKYNLKI